MILGFTGSRYYNQRTRTEIGIIEGCTSLKDLYRYIDDNSVTTLVLIFIQFFGPLTLEIWGMKGARMMNIETTTRTNVVVPEGGIRMFHKKL